MSHMNRRTFFLGSFGVGFGAWSAARAAATGPNEKVSIGMIGFRGRGGGLLSGFLGMKETSHTRAQAELRRLHQVRQATELRHRRGAHFVELLSHG